jgi:hypothetical protein
MLAAERDGRFNKHCTHMDRIGLTVAACLCFVTINTAAQVKSPARLKLVPARPEYFVGGGPPGGEVCTVVVDGRSPDTLYAAVFGGGILKSTDGGKSWRTASRGLPAFTGCDLTIDPDKPGTLYAGALGRIYKTVSGGSRWRLTDSGLPEAGLPAIDPSKPDTLYTKTRKGLFKSVNSGKSWFSLSSGLPQVGEGLDPYQFLVDPANSSILYDGSSVGIFKSYDAGKTWTPINSGLPENRNICALAMDPTAPDTLYASTLANGAVFKTTDGGDSWSPSNSGMSQETDNVITKFLVDPLNASTVYGSGPETWVTQRT